MSRRGLKLFIANSIIWGMPFWLTKIILTELSPSLIVFLRAGTAAVILVPMTWRSGALRSALTQWPWVLVFALAQIAIPWWLTGTAQKSLESSFTGLLMTAIPIVGLFLAFVAGENQMFTKRALIGLIIGVCGVILLIGLDAIHTDLNMGAIALVIIATFGFAYAPRVVNRHLQEIPSLGAVALTVLMTTVIWSVPAAFSLPTEFPRATTVISVLVIGVVCTGIAFWNFFELIKEIGPTKSTYLAFTNPMVAVLVGIVFAQEPLTLGIICSFPLIITGTYLSISSRARQSSQ
jgi:drug/metabolite transporter (DMT)-like permease